MIRRGPRPVCFVWKRTHQQPTEMGITRHIPAQYTISVLDSTRYDVELLPARAHLNVQVFSLQERGIQRATQRAPPPTQRLRDATLYIHIHMHGTQGIVPKLQQLRALRKRRWWWQRWWSAVGGCGGAWCTVLASRATCMHEDELSANSERLQL